MTRRRLLVVDADASFLRFATELLTGAGYDVRGAGDALSAVPLALEFRPELVIVDVAMPGKDGFELAREGAGPAKATGAAGYLEKPVRSAALLWTIKTLLSSEDDPGAGEAPRGEAP